MRPVLLNIYTAALIALALVSSAACGREKEDERVDVYSQLQDVSKLRLAEMTVGKVGKIDDPEFSRASGFMEKAAAAVSKIKPGSRIGVYSFDTYISAYIDLSELKPGDIEVDRETNTARVKLPPIRIEQEGRDMQLREIHYRVTGMRSAITPDERARLKESMSADLRREIEKDPDLEPRLRDAARRKATAYFSGLLRDWGYTPEITFSNL